jgi:hypothetical protein
LAKRAAGKGGANQSTNYARWNRAAREPLIAGRALRCCDKLGSHQKNNRSMLYVICNFLIGASLVAVLVAVLRSIGPKYHSISAGEVHPDLQVDEELLRDAMSEYQRWEAERPPAARRTA